MTKARSVSAGGALSTTAGRTFAVMPRSTSHTSPRAAMSVAGFALVEFEEDLVCERHEIGVYREIVVGLGHAPQQLGNDFLSLRRWKRLDGVEHALGCLRHD